MKQSDRGFVKAMGRELMVHRGLNCYDAVREAFRFVNHFDDVMANMDKKNFDVRMSGMENNYDKAENSS